VVNPACKKKTTRRGRSILKKHDSPVIREARVGDHTYFFSEVAQRKLISSSLTLILFAVFLCIPFLSNPQAHALALTWDGGGADNNWSTCANWSSDTCPSSGDALTFNSTSTKDSVVDASFAGGVITSINITTGYSGTVSLARSLQTTSTFTHSTGTFTANAQTLDVDGGFSTTGGTFNASSGIMTFGSTFTTGASSTFNANSGTITFDTSNSATITCNSKTYNLVTFAHPSSTKTISSGCDLPLGNNPTIGSGTAALSLSGTISGTGTITMTGGLTMASTGALTGFTGFSTSSTVSLTSVTKDFSSYTTFVIGSTFSTGGTSVITLPNNADFNGAFTPNATTTLNMPLGSVTFASTFTVLTGTTFNANSGTVVFDGGAASIACGGITFSSVTLSNTAAKTVGSDCTLPLGSNPSTGQGVTLNGTLSGSGTLTMGAGSTLSISSTGALSSFTGLVAQALTITGKTIDFSTYTTFSTASAFTIQTSANVTLPSNADINNTFALNSSSTLNMPNGSVYMASTMTLNSGTTFNANSGTVVFDGTTTATLTCNSATFNLVSFAHSAGTKTVSSGCTFPMGNNPSFTNTVTVVGSLTGSGTLTVSGGTFTMSTGSTLSGFTGLHTFTLTVAGSTMDYSAYTTFDVDGNFNLSSGTFTAPSGTMNVAGNFTVTGTPTFNHSNGTVELDSATSSTISCSGITLNLVTITASAAKVISAGCSLPLGSNPSLTPSITLNGTLTGTGTLTILGTSFFYNSTAALTGFTGLDIISLTLTTATFDLSPYSSVILGGNLSVGSGSSLTGPAAGMTIASGFNIVSGGAFNANGGTLTLGGTSRPGTVCDGTTTLTKVVLSNTAGTRTVEASCTLPLGDNPTVGAGGDFVFKGPINGTGKISAPTGSTLAFVPGSSISGFSSAELGNLHVSINIDASNYTSFKVNNDFTLVKPANFKAPSGTFEVKGNIYNSSDNGFLRLNGAVGERAYTTDTAATSITGDIDIRVNVALDMWSYGQQLIGKYNATGNNRCYQFGTNSTTGFLGFGGSLTGASTTYSASSTVAPSVSNFGTTWVRVTRNATTGDVKFYTSSDGSAWTQLGATVSTTAGALYDCAADLDIGANSNGTGTNAVGRFYKVQIRNNILDDGTGIAYDADFTGHATGTTSFTESSSNAATVQLGTGTSTINGPGAGTFDANNGTVTLTGTDQTITGDWSFNNLTKEVTTSQTLTMPAGNTVSVAGLLTLKGTSYDAPLSVVSSSTGTRWNISRNGTSSILYAYIKDGYSTNGTITACSSVNGGNNINFAFNTTACTASTSSTRSSSSSTEEEAVTTDTEVTPGATDINIVSTEDTPETVKNASFAVRYKWPIVAFSLLVAGGGIWWLLALKHRKYGGPVQWQ